MQIKGVAVLLARNPAWTERLLLRLMRALYTRRLRGLVAALPSDITSEILAASEKMTGHVEDSLGTDGAGCKRLQAVSTPHGHPLSVRRSRLTV